MIARYTRPELVRLWSDDHRYDIWLRVELAACEEMEAAGTVPRGTAAEVRSRAAGKLSAARILEHEERTRHDVIAFLTHVEELAGEPARWLHLGMTSSDVLDAALAVQLVEAADQILDGIDKLRAACRRRADEERATPAIGRSHGIHAEPITAGLVFAGFFAEVGRARRALVAARAEIAVGKIAGAVGTYANLDPALEARALARLGLQPEVVPTQIVARDRHAAYFAALARVGTAVERIALTVRHWQRTEVGEATEAFGKGQKGSSAMPHKKNPILSENLCGIARLLRGYAQASAENVALWHERDISHSSVERVIGPDATGLCDFMVRRAAGLVDGLVINRERMRRNLDLTGGLFFSEAVLLLLVRKGMARQAAYDLVQRNAMQAAEQIGAPSIPSERSFRVLLTEDPDIATKLTPAEIDQAFDLKHHLRYAGAIIDRALHDQEENRP
ncbi:MAG TPA: adenylosuccinate lyase [Polyangia bacterium]|jgi:adenylosuccinate lyase|nr:adenylosuccinate lyase [Polyangia bacterium]